MVSKPSNAFKFHERQMSNRGGHAFWEKCLELHQGHFSLVCLHSRDNGSLVIHGACLSLLALCGWSSKQMVGGKGAWGFWMQGRKA